MKAFKTSLLLLASCLLCGGCGKTSGPSAADEKPQLHKDVPPHGGTPVALGDDYNLELVRDAESGTLSGYVLDDEMEEFMRSSSPVLTITATVNGEPRTLVLAAVANSATGETVGDTSQFQGQADWIKTATSFEGTVQDITIRGSHFAEVKFNFPQGNDSK
jgi:hypothetical protein